MMPAGGGSPNHDFRASVGDLYGSTEDSSPRPEPRSFPSPQLQDARATTDHPRRGNRQGPSDRYRREREHAHSGSSHREVLRLLIEHEYEVGKMRKALYSAFERIQAESNRANEAERARAEMLGHFRTLNDSRAKALRDAEKASQELRMYQIQYANAQREIHRAQEVLKILQEQKEDAERSAARSRRIARELNQNRLVTEAREEGRRLGFAAGFRRARTEWGVAGDDELTAETTNLDEAMMAMDLRAEAAEDYYHDDHDDSEEPAPQRLPTNDSSRRSPPPPEPEPITLPAPRPAPPPPSQSPAVQVYSLPIPPADQVENGIRRAPSVQPPDNYIPQTTDMGFIALPLPFEFTAGSRYPQLPPASPRSPSVKLPSIPPEDPAPRPHNARPPSGPLPDPHPISKTSSSHSRRHSVGSGSTSSRISQIDLLKSAPKDRPLRPQPERELSMIREDGNSSRMGTPSHQRSKSMTPQPSQNSMNGRAKGNGVVEQNLPTLEEQPPFAGPDMIQPDASHQRFADELRYSNPQEVEEWRISHPPPPPPSSQRPDRPPRYLPRPSNLTVPAPLSSPPENGATTAGPSAHHMRSMSDASSGFYTGGRRGHTRASSNSLASSLGKPIAGFLSTLTRSRKEPREGSEEITINVDPPSGPSSGRTNFQQPLQADNYLSPQSGPAPLPMPNTSPSMGRRGPPLVPTVPNTPEMPPQYWPDPGPVAPSSDARQGSRPPSRATPNGPRGPSPSRSRSPSPNYIPFPQSQPVYHSPEYASREPFRPTSKSSLRRVTSPASMASTARASEAHSQAASKHGRSMSRSESVGNGNGSPFGTPASMQRGLPPGQYAPAMGPSVSAPAASGHALHRSASNASFTSQGSYNPDTYLDPAYYPPENGNPIPRPASRTR